MKNHEALNSYNARIFRGNPIRSRIHHQRFYWLLNRMGKVNADLSRIVELGCFDAKTLNFLDRTQITKYVGLDANWEGGLDIGKELWAGDSRVQLHFCVKPDDIPVSDEPFTLAVAMETFEHIPVDLVEPYLRRLSELVNGHIFITVPIERGGMWVVKHGLKKLLNMKDDPFTKAEVWNSIIGRLDKVRRNEHKGFDERVLVKQVAKYFDIVEAKAFAPGIYPQHCNFAFGIVGKTKDR